MKQRAGCMEARGREEAETRLGRGSRVKASDRAAPQSMIFLGIAGLPHACAYI